MPALARNHVTHSFTRAANEDCINGGPCTRTKYSYDAAGHVTGYGTNGFTYNNRGRMAATVANSTDYLYNALGQMIEKSGTAGTTVLMQDESGHLLGEYNGSGQLIEETIWLGDIPVATLQPNGSGGVNIFYVHTDHLNTPRKVAQPATGTLAWRWDADPFGTAAPNQNPAGLGTLPYNLRFPGQYYQAETGLNQNWNRDYDPLVGRYIESDPTGLYGGSWATYAYVGGNPVSGRDRSGLTQQDVVIIQNYINLNFPDISRSNGYLFGDLAPDVTGSTDPLTGITVLPSQIRCEQLTEDQFAQLFETMLHESMHSTDPWWQRFWDTLWGNKYPTANHQSIYNRSAYELIAGHRFPTGPMWGSPGNFVPNVATVYAGSRAEGNEVPCGCSL